MYYIGIDLIFTVAIRKVAAGHKMVAEGWAIFEDAAEDAGPGQLPTLLRQLVSNVTPTATPTPMDTGSFGESTGEAKIKKEFVEEPVAIKVETNKYRYGCGNCDVAPMATKRGMDAHIRAVHTKKPLLCGLCQFTTYNLDSLQRHEKEHK